MNESEKNIETCLPENILAEVASVPTDPQFVSLVNESLDPLKQQSFQQAGSDAYNEVVASHQPYTFTSQVAQMKSNLILLLRRFWRFPFGAGTIRSLSDMWQHYITRLQGSETYGIPSRLDQLTDLPSAPLLVADRKISGVPEAEDGMSLVQLLGGAYNDVEELTDDNRGWTIRTDLINTLKSIFPNLTKLSLGFKTAGSRIGSNLSTFTGLTFPGFELQTDGHLLEGNIGVEDLTIPVVQIKSTSNWTQSLLHNNGTTKILRCPRLKYMTNVIGTEHYGASKILVYDCNGIEEIYAEELEEFCSNINGAGGIASGAPNLKKVVVGNIRIWYCQSVGPYFFDNYRGTTYDNLLHLEFKSLNCSLNLKNWTAANVLQNNLQQFLSNFRSFIVLRLANRKTTTALTLTLSAAVYNAVTGANSGWASQHTLAELGITDNDLTDLETELGITSATIYASWLDTYTGLNGIHWDINKAN